ncbi:Hypothetical predicted protein [Octopus vulgaris]|uniref:Uncharacterized protein n=1 Tax=Octopus vulgaris TaxID=6645 RepID=A0AA36BG44_OCTVU|nr:Hypothetical predicted protein [Octopus vulgaris]
MKCSLFFYIHKPGHRAEIQALEPYEKYFSLSCTPQEQGIKEMRMGKMTNTQITIADSGATSTEASAISDITDTITARASSPTVTMK